MDTQTDLFGEAVEQNGISIPGNKVLEDSANLVMHLLRYNPNLLDGDNVAKIDRRIFVEAMLESGLRQILIPEQVELFTNFVVNLKGYQERDALGRARRWLLENDKIRISKGAILNAESQKVRIAGAMHNG